MKAKLSIKQLFLFVMCAALSFSLLSSCAKPEQSLSVTELLSLGEKHLFELDYEQALVQFLKVIEIEPMNARGYTGAADAYIRLGRDGEAAVVLRQGLEQLPENAAIQAALDDYLTGSSADGSSQTPTPPDANNSDLSSDNIHDTIIVTGSVVRADLSAFTGPTYVDGIKFAEPITMPSGEVVSSARLISIEAFGDVWLEYNDNIPQLKESVYGREVSFAGQLKLDEAHTNGAVPHPNPAANLSAYVNDPWGPYMFAIDSAEVAVADVQVNILPDMSKPERTALHTLFSNFSEVYFNEFAAENYSQNQLIDFALWHNYRNNWNRFSQGADGTSVISAVYIEQSISYFFGISGINHEAYTNNLNYYQNGSYYFFAADGAPLSWSQVTSFIENGDGTFTAQYDVYHSHAAPDNLYEDISDWHLNGTTVITKDDPSYLQGDVWEASVYTHSCIAVVAPHEFNGRRTYKLLSLAVDKI